MSEGLDFVYLTPAKLIYIYRVCLITYAMTKDLIVYAPHVCVVSPLTDPGCDFRSRTYAKILSGRLKGRLVVSRTLRAVCDNNRVKCRNTPSRRRLRELISPGSFVLEVHTYDPQTSRWRRGISPEPQVVILTTGNEAYAKRTAGNIRQAGFDVEVLKGGHQNDIQKEVTELSANGLLLELSQKLTPVQVRSIADALDM